MAKIDRAGIAIGVVFGILGQSIYDTFFYLFSGQLWEEWKASAAGLTVAIILFLLFYITGYLKETKETRETKP